MPLAHSLTHSLTYSLTHSLTDAHFIHADINTYICVRACIQGRATVSIESVNTYLLQNMEEQRKGKPTTWACIAATVTDQVRAYVRVRVRVL